MNPNQKNRPIENLLEGLSQHARFLTKEERKAELRERGIDVDGFLTEAHSIIAHFQKEERLAWMKIADEKRNVITKTESCIESWLGKGDVMIRTAFEKLIKTAVPQQTLAFRNKADLTVDDMARILDDFERLRKRPGDVKPSQEKQ
jgi:hypothetical protein